MMKLFSLLTLSLLLAGCIASAEEAATSKDAVFAAGEKVYTANCVACHQATGAGLPPAFPSLIGSPVVTGDPVAHIEIILRGKAGTAMISYAHLSDEELAAVMTYQRNAWGNQAEVDLITPEMVAAQRN